MLRLLNLAAVLLPLVSGLSNTDSSSNAADAAFAKVPEGCRPIKGDDKWPAEDVWMKELPGVAVTGPGKNGQKHPDYRLTVKNVQDAQNAMKFASKYGVRVSIINSGHDYMGRNDAPTGLWIDVSRLKGVRISPDWTPTAEIDVTGRASEEI